jgi:heme-degrading monooxygenase HmoA
MRRVVSIHHYRLKPGVSRQTFLQTIQEAQSEHLFELPGLEGFHVLHGIKGEAESSWSVIWIYSSRSAWEQLWGSPSEPKSKDEYPDLWRRWEDDLLAPLLAEDPDLIRYTAYEEIFLTYQDGSQ